MQKIASVNDLKKTIRQLESDQKLQASQLRSQFIQTTESLKPANLVRSAMESLIKSPWFMLIGINTIKSFGHRLIDKICSVVQPRDQSASPAPDSSENKG
jgi:hypothetical protein